MTVGPAILDSHVSFNWPVSFQGLQDDPGINQRALQALYREMAAKEETWRYLVSLSAVEIYNEVIR